LEEMHLDEVNKMLRTPGDLARIRPSYFDFRYTCDP
jgi:hypothetical protein